MEHIHRILLAVPHEVLCQSSFQTGRSGTFRLFVRQRILIPVVYFSHLLLSRRLLHLRLYPGRNRWDRPQCSIDTRT